MSHCCGYSHFAYFFNFINEVWFQSVSTVCLLFVGAKIKFVTTVSEGFSGRLGIKFGYLER